MTPLAFPDSAPSAQTAEGEAAPARDMEVAAAAPVEAGLFDSIVGSLLGFLFG